MSTSALPFGEENPPLPDVFHVILVENASSEAAGLTSKMVRFIGIAAFGGALYGLLRGR